MAWTTREKVVAAIGGLFAVAIGGFGIYELRKKPAAGSPSAGADANGWSAVGSAAVPANVVSMVQQYAQQNPGTPWNPSYSNAPQSSPVGVTNVYGPAPTSVDSNGLATGPWYAMAVNGTTTTWYKHA